MANGIIARYLIPYTIGTVPKKVQYAHFSGRGRVLSLKKD